MPIFRRANFPGLSIFCSRDGESTALPGMQSDRWNAEYGNPLATLWAIAIVCTISTTTLIRRRIKLQGKEHEEMRKYWALFIGMLLAATIGLSACAEKKAPPPPPPPPPAAAPADNMAQPPAAPAEGMKPMEAPKK